MNIISLETLLVFFFIYIINNLIIWMSVIKIKIIIIIVFNK